MRNERKKVHSQGDLELCKGTWKLLNLHVAFGNVLKNNVLQINCSRMTKKSFLDKNAPRTHSKG